MPSSDQQSVAAIIAAYKPDASLVEAAKNLRTQAGHVIVVDDGSPSGSQDVFSELVNAGMTVIHQPENAGIAAALNAGVEFAKTNFHPDFYLTLDQDSQPNPEYVSNALGTIRRANDAGMDVGFVSASAYSGHPIPIMGSLNGFNIAFDPMQSGFMIPKQTFDRVGTFDAGLFIDGVDTEFTMRTRTAGLAVLVGEGCDIEHDLGRREPGKVFGRPIMILGREISYNYHSPSRVYYICRNGTLITRRYGLKAPSWALRRLVEEAKAHLLRFAFSPGRGKLLRAAAAGFSDALRGRTGRIPPALERKLR
ncbi:glycosyltransferase [Arthrobacter sp. M4]|uniref:glycosyltransferase n=1 Tax=Arthrobacter sp. M4 TaxID=218160 RepID=UPI001CDC77F0|nr:glycosyltransferase [Arthrobacter sp. M4]MCA4132251.1 glycosyltransferase [Arthrobacter sp. M4]